MPQTVQTGGSSYLTVDEYLKRADVRTVASLASVTGERVGSATDTAAMATALQTNERLAAMLSGACGEFELACSVGGRYSPDDLQALADDGGNGAALFFDMLAEAVTLRLYEQRQLVNPDAPGAPPWMYERVETRLQQLRDGERVLPFVESKAAGRPKTTLETAEDVEARNGVVVQMERFFGTRANRRGLASGGG